MADTKDWTPKSDDGAFTKAVRQTGGIAHEFTGTKILLGDQGKALSPAASAADALTLAVTADADGNPRLGPAAAAEAADSSEDDSE